MLYSHNLYILPYILTLYSVIHNKLLDYTILILYLLYTLLYTTTALEPQTLPEASRRPDSSSSRRYDETRLEKHRQCVIRTRPR